MAKLYYLGTCDTCKRIMNELDAKAHFELQDIKTDPITETQLDEMHKWSGSYEALFSRRARKFRSMGLHEQDLEESDYKRLILEEYTFLKRPVMVFDDAIFIGNSKKVVEAVKSKLA